MTTRTVRWCASLLATVSMALAWAPATMAQLYPGAVPPISGPSGLPEPGLVGGRIAEVEPVGPVVTMLRLEDGTRLAVPVATVAADSEVRVGAQVSARYVETPSGKVVVTLRAEPSVQAP